MEKKYPEYYPVAESYHEDFALKMHYLQLINLRYIASKEQFIKFKNTVYELEENDLNEFIRSPSLILLDTDSFLVFSRIVLDRIPRILKPLYNEYITPKKLSIRDFVLHLESIKKLEPEIQDKSFLENMLGFGTFFQDYLRLPRNDIVIHPGSKIYRSSINLNGLVTRYITHIDEENGKVTFESFPLDTVDYMFHKILDFCDYLTTYFIDKIRASS